MDILNGRILKERGTAGDNEEYERMTSRNRSISILVKIVNDWRNIEKSGD